MNTSLGQLHHQATDWLRELDFYTEEINLLLIRLEEAEALTISAILKLQFTDFKKQFKSLLSEIEIMKHDIGVRERVVEELTNENLGEDKVISIPEDVIFKDMKELAQEFADTRFLFNFFLSKQV